MKYHILHRTIEHLSALNISVLNPESSCVAEVRIASPFGLGTGGQDTPLQFSEDGGLSSPPLLPG